jgi:hypothetical protein
MNRFTKLFRVNCGNLQEEKGYVVVDQRNALQQRKPLTTNQMKLKLRYPQGEVNHSSTPVVLRGQHLRMHGGECQESESGFRFV